MDEDDRVILDRMIEKYGLVMLLSSMSILCGDRAEVNADTWQSTSMGKTWMQIAFWVAGLAKKIDDHRTQVPANYLRH